MLYLNQKSVEFTGELPTDDEVRKEFFKADVFALPSLQEGFGLVFLEAMAAGLPIVAAHAAAVPEVVPDGEAGILVPPGDVDALAEALIRLLKDEKLRIHHQSSKVIRQTSARTRATGMQV